MAAKSITCPSCGASDIGIDTAREHSVCGYCGTAIKTKAVLRLDTERQALERLKNNARYYFGQRQYDAALSCWRQAIQADRTDHESYWGVVLYTMSKHPDKKICRGDEWLSPPSGYIASAEYSQAQDYAPPNMSLEYFRMVEAHNTRTYRLHGAWNDNGRLPNS